MFQVCTEKITVYRINLLKVQKLVRDTLLSGYDIYPIHRVIEGKLQGVPKVRSST